MALNLKPGSLTIPVSLDTTQISAALGKTFTVATKSAGLGLGLMTGNVGILTGTMGKLAIATNTTAGIFTGRLLKGMSTVNNFVKGTWQGTWQLVASGFD